MLNLPQLLATLITLSLLAACSGGSSDASYNNGDEPILESLTVTPAQESISLGESLTYSATGIYSDGHTEDVTLRASWSSDDSVIATVSVTGEAAGLAPGVANITAELSSPAGPISDTATLEVRPAPQAVSLDIFPPEAVYSLGSTEDYRAILTYDDGSIENVTLNADWELDQEPPIIAAYEALTPALPKTRDLDEYGTAIAIRLGSDFLRARINGLEAKSRVEVRVGELIDLRIEPRSERIVVDTTLAYKAIGIYSDGRAEDLTKIVNWTSSSTGVASISNTATSRGIAQGKTPGVTTIGATLETFSDSTSLTVVIADIRKIDLFPPDAVINVGGKQSYTAIAYLGDGTTADVTASSAWASSAEEIATVSTDAATIGTATGLSGGVAQISATFSGVIGIATAEVKALAISALLIEPSEQVISALTTQQYKATVQLSDGRQRDVTSDVIWSSSSTDTAAINNADLYPKGLALGLLPGETYIQAALVDDSEIINASALLTVIAPDAEVALVVSPPVAEILVAEEQAYRANLLVNDVVIDITDTVAWSSSSEVAHISSAGVATGEAGGEAVISATFTFPAGTSAVGTARLTVKDQLTINEILVDPPSATQIIGGTQQYTARALISDGSDIDISDEVDWSSSDSAIAQIDPTGVAIGIANGAVAMTATLNLHNSLYQGQAEFIVLPPEVEIEGITVTPATVLIARGEQQQYQATVHLNNAPDVDVTDTAYWQSLAPDIAFVSGSGLASGLSEGATEVSATVIIEGESYSDSVILEVTQAIIDHLEITPRSSEVLPGQITQYTAIAVLSDSTVFDITPYAQWFVTNDNIAHVESGMNGGVTTGLEAGAVHVYIEFSYDGITYDCLDGEPRCPASLRVNPLEVVELQVTPSDAEVAIGDDQPYQATAVLNSGDSLDVTNQVTWSTSNSDIAQIDTTGIAVGLTPGNVSVLASGIDPQGNTLLGEAHLLVLPPPVTIETLVVIPVFTILIATPGVEKQYHASAIFSTGTAHDVTSLISWTSADPAVAKVSGEGIVTPVSAGDTEIIGTVIYAGETHTDSATLKVVDPITVLDVDVQPKYGSIYIDNDVPAKYTATASLSNGTSLPVTENALWSVDDPTIATVNQNGGVTGLKTGTTRIRADLPLPNGPFTCDDGCSAEVEVIDPAGIAAIQVTPADVGIAVGTTQTYKAEAFRNDGKVIDVTTQVSWRSADSSIATLDDPKGIFKGVMEGATTISATLVTASQTVQDQTPLTVTLATVVELQIEPINAEILVGDTRAYSATVLFTDGSDQNVTLDPATSWRIEEQTPPVAAIDPTTAIAQGLATGTATVTALYNTVTDDFTDAVSLIVREPQPLELRLVPGTSSVFPSDVINYSASFVYADGTLEDVTDDVLWSSDNESAISVSNDSITKGQAVANAPGEAVVSATHPNQLVGISEVIVNDAVLVDLLLEPDSIALIVGTSDSFSVLAIYSDDSVLDVSESASWTSAPGGVVTVVNGVEGGQVNAIAVGFATVTATYQQLTAPGAVTVEAAEIVAATIAPDDTVLAETVTERFRATAQYSNGTTQEITNDVTWSSSAPGVAEISNLPDDKGIATAVSPGTTMISATYQGLNIEAVPLVVVGQTLVSITVIPEDAQASVGDSIFYAAQGNYSSGLTTALTLQSAWITGNDDIASVNEFTDLNMVALANGMGSTTVTATFADISGVGNLTVGSDGNCGDTKPVRVIIEDQYVEVLGKVQFTAIGVWVTGCEQDITNSNQTVFKSSDKKICDFDSPKGGLADGFKLGEANVNVNYRGIEQEQPATCFVVEELP